LIFCWFLKEKGKGLIPDSLFSLQKLKNLLKDAETLPVSSETRYYKAILQNLFFATLNVEMNDPAMPRKFRGKNKGDGLDAHYLVPTWSPQSIAMKICS
jgi:adenine-specific DNA-methyltransferase